MGWKQDYAALRDKLIAKLDRSPEAVDKRVTRLSAKAHMSTAAALYVLAHENDIRAIRTYAKLDDADKSSIRMYQQTMQVNVSNNSKNYKPVFNITDSPFDAIQVGERPVFTKNDNSDVALILEKMLDQLSKANIAETDKADHAADIKTLAAELKKNRPNKNILNSVWTSIKAMKDIGQLGLLIHQLEPIIADLIK